MIVRLRVTEIIMGDMSKTLPSSRFVVQMNVKLCATQKLENACDNSIHVKVPISSY